MINILEKFNNYIYKFIVTLLGEKKSKIKLYILTKKSCIIRQIIICFKRDSITSLRQLYYSDPVLFKHQRQSNAALALITREIELTREQLHVYASEKGLIASNHVTINNLMGDSNKLYIKSCDNANYTVIPNGVFSLTTSKLNFILIIEKETIFQKFIDSNFIEIFDPCAIVCTRGFPDFGTKNLLHQLSTFELKFYILADYNPHGLLIALTLHRFNNSKYYTRKIQLQHLYWLQLITNPKNYICKESLTNRDKAILRNLLDTFEEENEILLKIKPEFSDNKRVIDIKNWNHIAGLMKKLDYGYQLDSIDQIVEITKDVLKDEQGIVFS